MSRSKQNKTIPPISPADLRDHADEERIGRVWERLEPSLSTRRPAPRPRHHYRWLAAAAVAASFAAGLAVGQSWTHADQVASGGALATPAADDPVREVLAAGTTRTNYALPNGGSITLSPGSIVDTVAQSAAGLTLRLVRGAATLRTGAGGGGSARLVLLVGNATVETAAGSLHVRHGGEAAEVHVLSGSADITSPDAQVGQRRASLGPQQRLTVPIRVATAQHPTPETPVAQQLLSDPSQPPDEGTGEDAIGWREQCSQADFAAAFNLLNSQAGGARAAVGAAQNAWDLMCISDAVLSGGGDVSVSTEALSRVVQDFSGDPNSPAAALQLGRASLRAGNLEGARGHFERVRTLSPTGFLAEDALCRLIQTEAQAGRADTVAKLAQEYRTQHPDGGCIDEIDRLLAMAAARQEQNPPGADAGAAPSGGPAAPPGRGSEAQEDEWE